MVVQNRISVSFDDDEFAILERLSSHTHKSKSELIRLMVTEFLSANPERFRRRTSISGQRTENIVLKSKEGGNT